MADTEAPLNGTTETLPSEQALALEEEEKREEEEKKKARDPPIVYKDLVDVRCVHYLTHLSYMSRYFR